MKKKKKKKKKKKESTSAQESSRPMKAADEIDTQEHFWESHLCGGWGSSLFRGIVVTTHLVCRICLGAVSSLPWAGLLWFFIRSKSVGSSSWMDFQSGFVMGGLIHCVASNILFA